MKLNTTVRLILSIMIIALSSLSLISCGSNPLAPDPIVSITGVSNATVSAYVPAAGTTQATGGTGTGSLTFKIQGSSIVLDTDTSWYVTGGVAAPATTTPIGITIFTDPVTGTGTYTQGYNYTNKGIIPANTVSYNYHTYAYRNKLTGTTGTVTGVIQVSYQ